MNPFRKILHEEEGVATIWISLMMMVFVAFIGLALDTGYTVWVGQKLQISADAAALAGGYRIKTDVPSARNKARLVAYANDAAGDQVSLDANYPNAPEGDIVVGRYDRGTGVFDPLSDKPNAIKVVARRTDSSIGGPVDLIFGQLFGIETFDMSRYAIAKVKGGLGTGVLILNEDAPCALDIRGTAGTIQVNGGVAVVDSGDADAACHAGQPTVMTDELYIVGGSDGGFDDKVNFEGDTYYDADYVPDPLLDLPSPNWDPANNITTAIVDGVVTTLDPPGTINVDGGATVTISPGYYSGGITVRNGTLNAEPGIYILDGVGLDDNGGDLFAADVMFHIIDSTPEDGTDSRVNLRGNGTIQITGMVPLVYPDGPAIDAELANISVPIFQARDNLNDSRILGTNSFSLDGTIYMPNNHLEIGGTSEEFATGLIADTLYAHGNGTLIINYQDQFGNPMPRAVFLVE